MRMQNDIKNANDKNSSKFSITQPVKGDDDKSEIIENKKYMLTVHFHLLCTGNIRATIFEDNGRISKRVRPIPTRVVPYSGIVSCIVNLLQQLALCYVCNGTIFRISGDIPQLKQIILTHKNYIFGERSIVIRLNEFSETVIARSENPTRTQLQL